MVINRIQRGWERPRLLNYALLPVTWCYMFIVWLRRIAYRIGLFPSHQLAVPVIVIGNLSVGGNGKTPLVIALVEHLQQKGYRPGVISRGYGGHSKSWPRIVDQTTTPDLVGDEPQLIFERCAVPVVVGPNRVDDGGCLLDNFDCDIIICDDGFQHYALKRDIDIVVVDHQFGFGNGWCLPSGPLREPPSGLKRANIVAVNATKKNRDNFSLQQPSFQIRPELGDAFRLQGDTTRALSSFRGESVHAVTGIGHPQRFFTALENLGIDIIPHPFPDHHRFIAEDLNFEDDLPLIMTEKDGIKCRRLNKPPEAWVVPLTLRVDPALYQRVEEILNQS